MSAWLWVTIIFYSIPLLIKLIIITGLYLLL